jgi:hypothetical protein
MAVIVQLAIKEIYPKNSVESMVKVSLQFSV